jgi:activator of hsp90 ATPase 1 family protein
VAEFRDAIEIDAPPQVVFDFLTTEAGLTSWMGQYAHLEPRPGGEFSVSVAGYPVRGRYLHVEPYSRVVVSWGFGGSDVLPPGTSTVEFRLVNTTGGTRVELTHSDLPDSELPGHAEGWNHFLPRLRQTSRGTPPGPDSWHPSDHQPDQGASFMTEPLYIVNRYHRAWTSGDVDAAMTLVADDITCRAPGIDLAGKTQYREFIAGFTPALVGLADIASFSDGNRVALFYYPQTAITATAPTAECFTVEDGLITDSVLVFDRLSFTPAAES